MKTIQTLLREKSSKRVPKKLFIRKFVHENIYHAPSQMINGQHTMRVLTLGLDLS